MGCPGLTKRGRGSDRGELVDLAVQLVRLGQERAHLRGNILDGLARAGLHDRLSALTSVPGFAKHPLLQVSQLLAEEFRREVTACVPGLINEIGQHVMEHVRAQRPVQGIPDDVRCRFRHHLIDHEPVGAHDLIQPAPLRRVRPSALARRRTSVRRAGKAETVRSGTLQLYYTSKQTEGRTNPETHWGTRNPPRPQKTRPGSRFPRPLLPPPKTTTDPAAPMTVENGARSEEHTSELQSLRHLVC